MSPRPGKEAERGAVLVETALVAGIILTFLLFSVQIGILGFLQVTADAASFVGARVKTVGAPTANPQTYTAGVFDQLKPSDVSSAQPQPAPSATVPVDYGYNNPGAHPNSQYQRNGGYSLLQPVLAKTSVDPSRAVTLLGMMAKVHGSDTEPLWTECGVHFNVANSNLPCGDSTDPTNYAVNYFAQGENTPPYFVGFDDVTHCLAPMPWGGPQNSFQTYQNEHQGTCPSVGSAAPTNFIGLGLAERFDTDNWTRSNPGVSGAGATFSAAACHQQYFANLATFFSGYPDLLSIYQTYYGQMLDQLTAHKISSMNQWHGFDSTTNGSITTIYNWDEPIAGGEPPGGSIPIGTYATKPEQGCP